MHNSIYPLIFAPRLRDNASEKKSLTIRVSKFLGFSNFLICIYCFYYIFITLFFNFYILEYIFLIILDNSKFVLAVLTLKC